MVMLFVFRMDFIMIRGIPDRKNRYTTGRRENKLETFIVFVKENFSTIVALCGVCGIGLEVAPVDLKPVSWCLKKIGAIMNSELLEKIEVLETEVTGIKKDNDEEKINGIRKDIVSFSLSCQRDEHHTRDEYDRIFERVDDYHKLLEKYKRENGKIDIEVSYINKVYAECLEQHKFFEG